MKLKSIALAMLLVAGGSAYAAPALQSCAPMEVTHNGAAGLSYILACDAGDWSLTYTGSVPAGTDSVSARYRVQVSGRDGSNFTQTRSIRLPTPAMLGQALLREAVVLDSGELAFRDCPEFSCTLYRPLGGAAKLAKASVTVTPEVKRLADEATRLTSELNQRQVELAAKSDKVSALETELRALREKLAESDKAVTTANLALETAKEQYAADIAGLLKSGKADLAKAEKASAAQANARVADITTELAKANSALTDARQQLGVTKAINGAAQAADIQSRDKQIADLKAALATATQNFEQAQAKLSAKREDLATLQAQPDAALEKTLAERQTQLQLANNQVAELQSRQVGLEQALSEARAQLALSKDASAKDLSSVSADKHASASAQKQLDAALLARETAEAEVARLTKAMADVRPAMEKLTRERDDALKGAQQVARDMLAALDKLQAVQRAKDDAEHALAATTNKVMDLSAKLQAANLSRELAMQAATTANADADAQNLKNMELAGQVRLAKEQLKSLITERYDLYAKLQATKVELDAVTSVKGAGTETVASLRNTLYTVTRQQQAAEATVDAQKQRIAKLETLAGEQSKEIASLREQLTHQQAQLKADGAPPQK